MIHFGAIPENQQVCHSCDNPQCIRPDHLFLGTQSMNQKDSANKGRHYIQDNKGSKHPLSKITEADVLQIRELRASGMRVVLLAQKFNVSVECIYSVIKRLRWGHV